VGVQAGLLGPLHLAVGTTMIRVSGERQRTCLALLLLARGRRVSSDVLCEELWGECPPAQAAASLQMQMSRLRRRLLGDAGLDPQALVAERGGYALRLDGCELDVDRFEALIAAGAQRIDHGDLEDGVDLLGEALALWRGVPLADAGDGPVVSAERTRLEARRTASVVQRADAELSLGRHAALVSELEQLCGQHPFEERLRGQLMLALYRSGRQADALAAYRACRQRLVDELGIEPTPELRQLNDAILRQDPGLAPPPAGRNGPAPWQDDSGSMPAAALTAPVGPSARTTQFPSRPVAVAGLAVAALAAVALTLSGALSGKGGLHAVGPGEVAVVAPDGGIQGSFSGVRAPVALAADGRFAWLADASTAAIIRLDPRAPRAVLSVTVDRPTALAVGEGGVWVVSASSRELQEVNEAAGEVVRSVPLGNGPVALATGDGAVWVADVTDGTLTRVDPVSARVVDRLALGGEPDAVAVGAGAVWVADAGSGSVDRIDPDSDRVTAAISTGGRPSAIAVAAGEVWVADPLDHTLSRIDPSSDTLIATLPVGAGGDELATDGASLWVDGPVAGELTRIDAKTAARFAPIQIGSPVAALAVAGPQLLAATTEGAAARRGGTLRVVGLRGPVPPAMADPAATFDQDSWQLQAITNDGLLAYRKTGGAPGAALVPDLAASMPVGSDGGRVWTFQLRRGIRYSTGQPVRASDVLASFERLERIAGPAVQDLPPLGLIGEAACRAHPSSCDLSRGVLVDDRDGIVTLRLVHPDTELLQRLAKPEYFILPAGTPPRPLTRPPLPATGPYAVVRRTAAEIDLARNPYFRPWSTAAQPPGYPDRIIWRLEVSPAAGLSDVLAGRADVLDSGAPAQQADLLATRDPTLLHPDPFPATEAIFLNTTRQPFTSLAVRQAVALATDRARLAADEGPTLTAPVTCQILPPGMPGYRPYCPYTANPGAAGNWSGTDLPRARALIQQAGIAKTTITLAAPSDRPPQLQVVRDFAQDLRAIGLRPRLILRPANTPGGGYWSLITNPRAAVQAGWFHWFVDRPDPAEVLDPTFTCPNGPPSLATGNVSDYCDPTTDAAIANAERLSAGPLATAGDAWAQIDARVTRAAAWIPFAGARNLDVTSDRTSGYAYNPVYSILLDQISVR
jgi:YVTN family beta-propeller protein